MAATDTDLFKDKIEVSLDGRQIFYLFFGGAVIATLVFVLGVMVGRRVEARALVEAGSPTTDPLAALDRMQGNEGLAFPTALRGDEQVMLGAVDEDLAKRKQTLKPGIGGPVSAAKPVEPAQPAAEAHAEPDAAKAKAEADKAEAAKLEAAAVKAEADKHAKAEADKNAKAQAAKAAQAEAEEAAEAEADKANISDRRFTLQVGSFQDKAEADQFFRGLASTRYEPYMVEADVPGKGKYYRVRVGGYGSFEEAVAAKSKFESSEHVIAYVTRLK